MSIVHTNSPNRETCRQGGSIETSRRRVRTADDKLDYYQLSSINREISR